MQNPSLPSMAVILPPATCLLSAGAWCALLAQRVACTGTIEWQMRLRRGIAATNEPRPRFDSGIPMLRYHVGAGGSLWFSSQDMAAWLTGMGFLVTHNDVMLECESSSSAVMESESTSAGEKMPTPHTLPASGEAAAEGPPDAIDSETEQAPAGVDAGPAPVSTSEIAAAFEGIKWGREEWLRNLQKGEAIPKWLAAARVQRGQPGPDRPSTWDPVRIGAELVQKGIATAQRPLTKTQIAAQLREKFAMVPCLVPWHRAWLSHEETLRSFGDIQ